jgi:hypothetical protein
VLSRTRRPRLSGRGNRIRFHPPSTWQQHPLEGIRESFRSSIAIEKALGENVQRARATGHSWEDIGRALDVVEDARDASDVIAGLTRAKANLWTRTFASPP